MYATFMPKPIEGAFGSGMHTHVSLFEGDVNAFHDPGDEFGLSKVGKCFIAGLLHHAREITAVTNQTVNSYKRLIEGYEAPVHICWARNNESALVRLPTPKKGKESSTRIEFRSPDPACNPYLAFSVMLAAGLKGIEEGYDLPPEATNNIFEMTPEERAAEGIGSLPQSSRRSHSAHGRTPSSWPRRWGSTCSTTSSATSGRSGTRLQGAGHPLGARPLPRDPCDGDPGNPCSSSRTRRPRCSPRPSTSRATRGRRSTNAAIATQSRAGRRLGGRGRRRRRGPGGRVRHLPRRCASATRTLEPVLLLVSGAQLAELEMREDLFDDFCLTPFHPKELEARLRHLFWRTGRGARPEIVEYGDLVLNLETYQAALGGRPLDLTYMEYELLKFFATHPSKVFTREQLLSRVWGYEYYGGARTVDVHVRRLRAKLGEEHANLIQTVRSVGYRFGRRAGRPASSALGSGGPGLLGRGAALGVVDEQPAEQRAPDRAAQHHRDRQEQQHDDGDDDASGDHRAEQ